MLNRTARTESDTWTGTGHWTDEAVEPFMRLPFSPVGPFRPFLFDIQPSVVPLLSTIALAVRTPGEGHSDAPLNITHNPPRVKQF